MSCPTSLFWMCFRATDEAVKNFKVKPTNLITCTISASTEFFFFLFYFCHIFFLIWYTFHKWTSLWLLNTSCTISFFLSVFNKHNRGDIQLRFKQNKHHPFKPMFFNDFSFSSDKCIVVFHFLKYYTVKKRKTNKQKTQYV